MAIVTFTLTIPAGEWLSNGVNCGTGDLFRIIMPDAWSGGNISFQLSFDGELYRDLFDRQGREVLLPLKPATVVPVLGSWGADLQVQGDWTKEIGYVKIRSGSRDYPRVQTEERVFVLFVSQP